MQSIFVSPFSLQKRIFAAGQVYRWFDSGEPVFIPLISALGRVSEVKIGWGNAAR